MKVPLSWLNEFVPVADLSAKDLADRLTFSGVEVEGIETFGHAYDGFVAAEIRAIVPHPGADRLRLCQVFNGAEELQIVCGASNFSVGDKACLAQLGSVLPNGTRIKRAKIRGIESFGMLCAEDELGLSDAHDGLCLLDRAVAAGTPLATLLPPPETVLDLEITWNRPDCLSILGIAREFAALLGRPLKLPDTAFETAGAPVTELADVRIEEPQACPRYVARVLTAVRNGPSPAWMRRRLEHGGVRPLGLIVDVTNYVMLECGQPLHAFDLARLADHTIVVRNARAGETMTTLDGTSRALAPEMLVIADAREAVAIAGVMGGAGSEVSPTTDSLLLESARFDAPSIKRTATRLGLRTESSHRFERGVDPALADWASRRAAALLASLAGARVAPGARDCDARPAATPPVTLRFAAAQALLGLPLAPERMVAILQSLGLVRQPADAAADAATFVIPSWRLDLACEADLIEELARLHGLDKLPDLAPAAIAVAGADDAPTRAEARCRQTLLGFGFSEAMHYSFLSAQELNTFDATAAAGRVVLPNPVSADFAVLRDSLLPQLTAALGRNAARQIEAPALFEIGRVFSRDAAGAAVEESRLALGFCGPFGRGALDRRRAVSNEEAALGLKGVIEALAARLQAGPPTLRPLPHPAFEPGWSTELLLGETVVGRLGLVKAALRHAWRLNGPLAVAELRLAPLLSQVWRLTPLRPVPPFPGVQRDLALLAPRTLTHETLTTAMRRAAPPELTAIRLFDIFESKELGSARRSMAYTLEFQSPERTLTDDEVNAACQRIVAALKSELHVEVREG